MRLLTIWVSFSANWPFQGQFCFSCYIFLSTWNFSFANSIKKKSNSASPHTENQLFQHHWLRVSPMRTEDSVTPIFRVPWQCLTPFNLVDTQSPPSHQRGLLCCDREAGTVDTDSSIWRGQGTVVSGPCAGHVTRLTHSAAFSAEQVGFIQTWCQLVYQFSTYLSSTISYTQY